MRVLRDLFRSCARAVAWACLVLAAASPAAAETPGSITFVAKNLVATANGTFHEWKVTRAVIDEEDLSKSRVEIEIDLASIDTQNEDRDEHLRDPDFFEVARYPKAKVLIASPRMKGDSAFEADVTLTMHGHTKTFPVEFRIENREARQITAEFTLNRMDWKIGESYSLLNPLSIEEEVPVRVNASVPEGS